MQGNDHEMIRQLNQGSSEALRRLYTQYRVELYTIAVSVLGDASLAEDCLQDVFVNLACKAGTLTIRGHLKGYLATALINRARDHHRRQMRRIGCSLDDLSLAASHGDPQAAADQNEQALALVRVPGPTAAGTA